MAFWNWFRKKPKKEPEKDAFVKATRTFTENAHRDRRRRESEETDLLLGVYSPLNPLNPLNHLRDLGPDAFSQWFHIETPPANYESTPDPTPACDPSPSCEPSSSFDSSPCCDSGGSSGSFD